MSELTKVLLAAPAVIPPTMLSYQLATDIAKLFAKDTIELTMLHGPIATRGAFLLSMESQPDLVIYMGHGSQTALCGESFFCDMLTTTDVSYLRNKVVIANPACDTGAQLAPTAVQVGGCRCFMGALTPMYAAFPEEEHDYQADWFDYISALYRAIVGGKTTGESIQAYYEKCTQYMNLYEANEGRWENADWYYQATAQNRDQFKLFGDANVRLSPDLETSEPLAVISQLWNTFLRGLGLQ